MLLNVVITGQISNKGKNIIITRTKTSIVYDKENDAKKRETRREIERKVEGEI